jgi:outer membrane PBP1 activator LpoA protein
MADRAPARTSPPEPAAVPEGTIVAESRSFASALALWHRDHDAGAALAALDAHERRFPAGQIQLEARLLRAEILLASARDREALALLDQLGLGGVPRTRELRTVRGELRIKAGRCADGKTDLQAVLANGESDAFAQRARRAIAACP